MGVARAAPLPAAGDRRAVVVVEEDHVHVAGVVHLAAAELPHREHDRPRRLARRGRGPAEPLAEPGRLERHHLLHERLGDAGQRGRRGVGVLPAEDVAHAHPQLLRRLEGLEDRLGVHRPAAELGEARLERLGRRQRLDHETVEQLVDHARIGDEQIREERARGAEPHRQVERRRMEAEQLPEHTLAAQRIGHRRERGERGVGVGRVADRGQEPRGDRGEEVPAAAGREEPHPLLPERGERAVRGVGIPEAVPREHGPHRVGVGLGVEHEIDLRLGGRIVRDGVVEEMIEDAAIEGGRLRELGPEPLAAGRVAAVAEPAGEPAELRVGRRQGVRLAIVEDLEPMLDGAEERGGAFEDLPLLVGEAAGRGEPPDRLERGPRPDGRRVAPREQLEKLDRELDVTDAAAARLHVGGVAPRPDRPLLDPPLERLDAADVGAGEPAPPDPGLQGLQQPPPEVGVAAHAAGLDPRLPLPGAARLVEVAEHRLECHRCRPGAAVRPQPQVHAVGDAVRRRVGHEPHGILHDAVEELLVGGGPRAVHAAVGRVHEHEIDVAGVVELAAPELPEREHRDRRGAAVGLPGHAPLPGRLGQRRP